MKPVRMMFTGLMLTATCAMGGADELSQASWDWPAPASVRDAMDDWVDGLKLADERQQQIRDVWKSYEANETAAANATRLFDAVIRVSSIGQPKLELLVAQAERGQFSLAATTDSLPWPELPSVVANNLRLFFGKSLALSQLYDEAQVMLSAAEFTELADPAALLFYRAVVHYRLREKEAGLKVLDRLFERQDELPERYASLARLMKVDLQQLKDDSLDDVARIMDSIKVRLGHGHAGTRVRKEEQDVVDKLEKMIDQLEQQLAQMQKSQGSGAGGLQSSAPAQDSMLPGGTQGQGDVDSKQLKDDVDWGNLPPKERERTIQQLGKEFPSHYRDIIEEYFRNLAQENQRDK